MIVSAPTPSFTREIEMELSHRKHLTDTQKQEAITWMQEILATQTLAGSPLPSWLTCHIYVNNEPKIAIGGQWHLSGSVLYCGQECSYMSQSERIGALANIAAALQLQVPNLLEMVTGHFVRMVQQAYTCSVGAVVQPESGHPPTRIAFSYTRAETAVEIQGTWRTSNGEEVRVDETWTIMTL